MSVLIVGEHNHRALNPQTLTAATAAFECGGDIHLLIAGHDALPAATEAARIAGVSRVLLVESEGFLDQLDEAVASQVIAIASHYSHIVFSATARGKSIAPRVAAALDTSQVSEVTRIIAPDTFERPIYAGSIVATVQCSDPHKVLTVRGTGFQPAQMAEHCAEIERLAPAAGFTKSRLIKREIVKSDRPDLSAAEIVVSGGRGLGSSENFEHVLTPLADKLGAALGASRAAVDAGYAPNNWQIGQTGRVVAPELYIACGISGAIQHLAGMKDSKFIVAINKDPDAPIFSIADYGLVSDLFEAIPSIVQSLES